MKLKKLFKPFLYLTFLVVFLTTATPIVASDTPSFTPITLTLSHSQAQPGETVFAYLDLSLPKNWHTYGKNPGDAGQPLKLTWELQDGFIPQDIQWQTPESFKTGPLTSSGYKNHVIFKIPITISKTIKEGSYPIKVHAFYLLCNESCIPKREDLTSTLTISKTAITTKTALDKEKEFNAGILAKEKKSISFLTSLKWLLFSFLGGLILNIMPCVFPILSLKAISLLNTSETSSQRIHAGWIYTAGVVTSMTALGLAVLLLQQLGAHIGWGFHLQSPVVVTLLVWLMAILGLYFSGWFNVPEWLAESASTVATKGYKLSKNSSIASHFITGVLAVFVAAPCTAPFMATTLGVALLHPGILSVEIFICLGLGLASPYLLLCYSPALQKLLPKPGKWMKTVEKILAIPLFITALWLVSILAKQVSPTGLSFAAIGIVSIMGLARLNRFFNGSTPKSKQIVRLMVIAGLLGLLFKIHDSKEKPSQNHLVPAYAIPYSETALAQAKQNNQSILLDVTASWCITCEVNRKTVLESKEIQAMIKQKNITVVVADWTHYSAEITALLKKYNRSGVPLVVFIDSSGKETILPQILTIHTVKKIMETSGEH